jgi:hypothetical protein
MSDKKRREDENDEGSSKKKQKVEIINESIHETIKFTDGKESLEYPIKFLDHLSNLKELSEISPEMKIFDMDSKYMSILPDIFNIYTKNDIRKNINNKEFVCILEFIHKYICKSNMINTDLSWMSKVLMDKLDRGDDFDALEKMLKKYDLEHKYTNFTQVLHKYLDIEFNKCLYSSSSEWASHPNNYEFIFRIAYSKELGMRYLVKFPKSYLLKMLHMV